MPELPEVETIKRQIAERIIGRKIKSVNIQLPKLIFFEGKKGNIKNFKKRLIGSAIKNVSRRAKILILTLLNGYSLLIHLKLTGQLIFRQKGQEGGHTSTATDVVGGHPWPTAKTPTPNKWTHITIYFTDGSTLYFNDLRQFGYMKLVKTDELLKQNEIQKLGPEPFDKNFTPATFKKMLLRRPKAKIKQLLLDQNFLAGVGNIYADESLFFAGVLPTRPVRSLKPNEIKKIYKGIKSIMEKAIQKGGTSVNSYVMLLGEKGGFEKYLKVYSKEGKRCPRCGGKIKRIKLGGRSAHFCPVCQK